MGAAVSCLAPGGRTLLSAGALGNAGSVKEVRGAVLIRPLDLIRFSVSVGAPKRRLIFLKLTYRILLLIIDTVTTIHRASLTKLTQARCLVLVRIYDGLYDDVRTAAGARGSPRASKLHISWEQLQRHAQCSRLVLERYKSVAD